MANHAYVIPDKLPDPQRINDDVFAIVKRKFPQFQLEFDATQNSWMLSYKGDGYIAMTFWLDEYGDPETFDEATEKWGRMLPCIEFRHGHAYQFMWWVEYEIREELARLYNAQVVDDGLGTFDPPQLDPQLERYDTYRDYLVRTRWDELESDPAWKEFLNRQMDIEREALPDELKPLIGGKIE
jgi:hypothetical protein